MNASGAFQKLVRRLLSLWGLALLLAANALTIESQRRDPVTGVPTVALEDLDPRHVGIVVVDMWNYHWCKTSTERVGALVPRMNRCLEVARAQGMTIFLCPTDVADNYVGTPMVEKVIAIDPLPLPQVTHVVCPAAPDGGGCTCGPERCHVNYGWDGMHPDLIVGTDDLMPNDPGRLYAICKQRGITHLVFMGVHTQVCLLGKSIGLKAMTEAGFHCYLSRDLTDAHGRYEPGVETPDDFTAKVVAHFEKHLAPTMDFAETLRRNHLWKDEWIVDVVRHAPWGTRSRPHLFENELIVTLTQPGPHDAEIHYTLDGTEPGANSPRYLTPLHFDRATTVRAAAFQKGRRVTRISESYAARLGVMPPPPEVALGSIKPWRWVGLGHSPAFNDHRLSPGVNPPQTNLSNEGKPLRIAGHTFEQGIGVHAPNHLIYEIQPGWTRFVALAGMDDRILDVNNGSNIAMHPSVIFRVFIDGKLVAESPTSRIGLEPWRFDVPIPAGSKRITLASTDAGDGFWGDLANWTNAGFITAAQR